MVASSGAGTIAGRGAMRVGALSGLSSTAWNAGRAAHSAFASNDTKFFCELTENTLNNPAIVNGAIGMISGAFLSKLVMAQGVGIRAFGGVTGVVGVTGLTTAVEYQRWNEAETALQLAHQAQQAGRTADASCFLEAREQQLAGIALDLTTLAAGTLAGASPKPTQSQLRAAEQSRIASERLRSQLHPAGAPAAAGDAWSSSHQAGAASSGAKLFSKDEALRSALHDMSKVDDLLDLSVWSRLWIRAEAKESGETLTLSLYNRLSGGRVVIDVLQADAAAAERVLSPRHLDDIHEALTSGQTLQLEL